MSQLTDCRQRVYVSSAANLLQSSRRTTALIPPAVADHRGSCRSGDWRPAILYDVCKAQRSSWSDSWWTAISLINYLINILHKLLWTAGGISSIDEGCSRAEARPGGSDLTAPAQGAAGVDGEARRGLLTIKVWALLVRLNSTHGSWDQTNHH